MTDSAFKVQLKPGLEGKISYKRPGSRLSPYAKLGANLIKKKRIFECEKLTCLTLFIV